MKRMLFCLLLGFFFFGFGQTKVSKSEAIKASQQLFYRAFEWRYSKPDSAYALIKKIEFLEKNHKSEIISAYKNAGLAIYNLEKYKLLESEKHALIGERYFKKLGFFKEIALMQWVLGRIYQNKSDYVKASEYFFSSNAIAEKINYYEVKILNDKNLAFVFLDQKDIKKAHYYVLRANRLAQKTNNKIELGFTEGVFGEILRSENKRDEANIHFQKAFDYFNAIQLDCGKAWTLTNWSIVFESDIEKSQNMQRDAQKIWNKIAPNNVMSIANQYNIGYNFLDLYDHGNILKHLKNYNVSNKQLLDSSLYYIEKSLDLAKSENNLQWQMYCYGTLKIIYYEKKDYSKFLKGSENYYTLKDSIYSQENKNKIAELEVSKTMALKNKEIELNRIAIENKEKQKWYLMGGMVLLGIIGVLLFYQNQNRKKVNEKLQLLNAELDQANKIKTRFFSILNHDLRSPVSNLIHFLHLQKESPELLDETSRQRMENKTISSAENLLNSMEDILLWSKGQMENFKPQPKTIFADSLFRDTQNHFSSIENIIITFENPENLQFISDENYLKTIIRNLTGNAIKALEKTQNATIIWKAWQKKGQHYLSITDNGSGGTQEQFKGLYDETEVVGIQSGLGLHLIRDLAKAIDCEITVDSKENLGTTFTLMLP